VPDIPDAVTPQVSTPNVPSFHPVPSTSTPAYYQQTFDMTRQQTMMYPSASAVTSSSMPHQHTTTVTTGMIVAQQKPPPANPQWQLQNHQMELILQRRKQRVSQHAQQTQADSACLTKRKKPNYYESYLSIFLKILIV